MTSRRRRSAGSGALAPPVGEPVDRLGSVGGGDLDRVSPVHRDANLRRRGWHARRPVATSDHRRRWRSSSSRCTSRGSRSRPAPRRSPAAPRRPRAAPMPERRPVRSRSRAFTTSPPLRTANRKNSCGQSTRRTRLANLGNRSADWARFDQAPVRQRAALRIRDDVDGFLVAFVGPPTPFTTLSIVPVLLIERSEDVVQLHPRCDRDSKAGCSRGSRGSR